MHELMETSIVLRNATARSLVVVDELGRGTSTFDGLAIAFAVMQQLSQMHCATFFSTHYHQLAAAVAAEATLRNDVRPMHMSALVDSNAQRVTFLFKLADGVCPKSHGLNCALMAGIDSAIVSRAQQVASQFETVFDFLSAVMKANQA